MHSSPLIHTKDIVGFPRWGIIVFFLCLRKQGNMKHRRKLRRPYHTATSDVRNLDVENLSVWNMIKRSHESTRSTFIRSNHLLQKHVNCFLCKHFFYDPEHSTILASDLWLGNTNIRFPAPTPFIANNLARQIPPVNIHWAGAVLARCSDTRRHVMAGIAWGEKKPIRLINFRSIHVSTH